MCEPLTIAAAAVTLGSRALSARQEHKEQNRQHRANIEAASRAYDFEMADILARELQERRAAARTIEEGQRQALRARESASVAAAAAGVRGRTVDALLDDFTRQQAEHETSVQENLGWIESQLVRAREAAAITRDARMSQTSKANPWVTGLKIGTGAVDTLMTFQTPKPGF